MITRFHLPLRHHAFTGYAQVIIYPTVEAVRVAAGRYSEGDFTEAHAVWQGNICYPTHPCTVDHRFLGVMRLPAHTTREDVIHECTHAALTAYRLHRGQLVVIPAPFHDHVARVDYWDEPEELLAYATADLATTCLAKLASLTDLGVRVAS